MDKYEYLWMKVRNNLLPGDISENGMTYEEIFSLSEKGLIEKLQNVVSHDFAVMTYTEVMTKRTA